MPCKILFVCTGNICRSPTAHAIARHKAKALRLEESFSFDSAGTSGYHQGESSDKRSVQACSQKNISFSKIKARQITPQDFENFDFIFCMDRSHLSNLLRISDQKYHKKIHLFLQFCATKNSWNDEVIDPYYGSEKGFDEVLEVIEKAIDDMFEILKD